jgi:hypothetical protein
MADEPTRNEGPGPPSAPESEEEIPLGQRLFDRPFLLLTACTVIMFVFFTGWGLWEIFTLPQAPLP